MYGLHLTRTHSDSMKHDSFLLINHTSHPHPPPPRPNIKIVPKAVTRPTRRRRASHRREIRNKLDTTERSLLFSFPPTDLECLSVGGRMSTAKRREGCCIWRIEYGTGGGDGVSFGRRGFRGMRFLTRGWGAGCMYVLGGKWDGRVG